MQALHILYLLVACVCFYWILFYPFFISNVQLFIWQFFGEQMGQVLFYADFVFGNEVEGAAYGAAKGYVGYAVLR
jgi:hypothetical protein